ncbi:DUF481 domain-containing protein [Aliivibrio kagoshimensis]
MKKTAIALLLFSSTPSIANTLHISPEMKFGPYVGAGISGGGLQLGVADTLGFDAIYLSYSHTSAEFLYFDKDRLKTYRLGAQYQLVNTPRMSLQLEGGWVEYEGSKKEFMGSNIRHKSGTGASASAAWVVGVTENIGFRAGADFNYIDNSNTFLSNSLSVTFSTGVVFTF